MIGLRLGLSRGTAGEILGPVNTVAPAITGSGKIGSEHTVSNGTWTGTGVITYARQWRRDGAAISGATGSAYTPVAADDQTDLTCVVTATDDEGSRSRTSAAVAITYAAPTLSGTPIDDVTVAANSGDSTFSATAAFSGTVSAYSVVSPISGLVSINASTGLVTIDSDTPIPETTTWTVSVTAMNSGGSVAATFDLTVDALLPEISDPAISGGTVTLTANRPGTATVVLNSTPSPYTGAQIVAEYTTPDGGTEATAQFVLEAGVNSDAIDVSGVTPGEYWLHVALEDEFDRLGSSSAQVEITAATAGTSATVGLLLPLSYSAPSSGLLLPLSLEKAA